MSRRTGHPLAWLGDAAAGTRLLATIAATVDLERVLADVRSGISAGADHLVVPEPVTIVEDPHLGARVALLSSVTGSPVALAEPSTEGRLAASLARHGEGEAGEYWRVPVDLDVVRTRAAAANVALSQPAAGPFGWSVLVVGERFARAHVILVEPAAVPSRP